MAGDQQSRGTTGRRRGGRHLAGTAGRKGRLELTINPFHALPARVRREVDAEAATVATARAATDVRVQVEPA
ncbi:hypothetical protein GCM10027614_33780 [Micromonospora vulcania]